MKSKVLLILFFIAGYANAQTLFVPNGTSGVGASNTAASVGLGISTPTAPLHIYSSVPEVNLLVQNSNTNGARTFLSSFVNKSSIQTDKDFTIANNSAGTWQDKFVLKYATGSIGIGTSNPTAPLHISGSVPELNLLVQSSVTNGARTYLTSFANKSSIQTDKDFSVRTSDGSNGWVDRFYIKNSGWVGVGIASPLAPMHIFSTSSETSLLVESNSGARTHLSSFLDKSAIQTDKDFAFVFADGNGWNEKVRIKNSGAIGIGINSPLAPLHIFRPEAETNLLVQSSVNEGARTFLTSFYHKSSIQTDYDFTIRTNHGGVWTDKLIVTNAGNVGIGLDSQEPHAAHKLDVNGVIHAEEVVVDLNVPGPDYVFEDTYKLPTLAEVETYIKENKHLPEVPSAKQMEAEGLKLMEMNLLLLKKVEELTLYVIELKKENEEQERKIINLENGKK